ncbi:MAG: PqiC family protein [Candidatus Omnitrophica bacterium]|nr:PqiC family protein [Candidatus Omnitrophota bacterium]
MKHGLFFRRRLLCAILVISAAGCISVPRSPGVRFYTLQARTGEEALPGAENLNNAVIGVGPVALPEYYNRPQLVTKNNEGTIEFAQFDRWAEPLDTGIVRAISRNLSLFLPAINVETFPWNNAIPITYQVILEVIELESRLDAEVMMLAQWSILDKEDKRLLFTKRAEYRQAAEPRGYPGIIRALSGICDTAARDIAETLTRLEQ